MTNSETVTAFVEAWNRTDWKAVSALLAEDVAYQNIPWDPVHGRDAVMANLASFNVERSDWIVLNQIAGDDLVMNERVDRVRMNGVWKTLKVMGIFRLRDGLIREWRDYFDPAELDRAIPEPKPGKL